MRRERRHRAARRLVVSVAVLAAVGAALIGVDLMPVPGSSSSPAASSGRGHTPARAADRGAGAAPAPAGKGGPGREVAPTSGTTMPTAIGGGAGDVSALLPAQPVQAKWVMTENARPGTTSWQIKGTPPGRIAGFADHSSAVAGATVSLYVTTDAPTFAVRAYRMGWYGGDDARLVWTSASETGVSQPDCDRDDTTNMVSCDNWSPSLSFPVTQAFVPGDYLLELVGSGGQESYVPLTVTDPSSHATYLVENDIYTWQAWNAWGGYDFYQGEGSCGSTYPVCNRARVVSFDRPYDYGQGAADFLTNEYPLIRLLEEHGLDVAYATSADVEGDPSMLLRHRAFLSLGHDECWSYPERVAAEDAEQAGVNMIFFGASAMLRHVRMEASPLGPLRQEVDYRDSAADPLDVTGPAREVTGNTWADPPASWSEVPFVGEEYTGYVLPGQDAVPLVVTDGGSWLFAGTGLSSGDEVTGVLVSDFDQVEPGISPANEEILAHSELPAREIQTNVRDPASDIGYWTDAQSGAGVFDTGTVAWIPDLQTVPVLSRMTLNLLALFGQRALATTAPSEGNWRQIYD